MTRSGARRDPTRVSNWATPLGVQRLALLALLALSGCPDKKPAAPAPLPGPEALFWTWFSFDEARLADGARGKAKAATMLEISQHAATVAPGITAEISFPPQPEAPLTLVLTANGDTRLFPKVTALVAGAPALKRWKVVAFRQRREVGRTLTFGDFTIHPEDFLFKETGRTADGKLDIEIHVKGLTPANEKQVDQAAFLLLDHAIGEYDTETKLHAIDIKPLAVAADATLKPLNALAALVDAMPSPADGG